MKTYEIVYCAEREIKYLTFKRRHKDLNEAIRIAKEDMPQGYELLGITHMGEWIWIYYS